MRSNCVKEEVRKCWCTLTTFCTNDWKQRRYINYFKSENFHSASEVIKKIIFPALSKQKQLPVKVKEMRRHWHERIWYPIMLMRNVSLAYTRFNVCNCNCDTKSCIRWTWILKMLYSKQKCFWNATWVIL